MSYTTLTVTRGNDPMSLTVSHCMKNLYADVRELSRSLGLMNWCTAVFISIFSVSVTASDYKASPSSTEITMFLGNTLQSHTQLHLLLMGDIEKAEQQMISGLGLDILILANIVSGEIEVGPKNHQHAINRLVALAVFREVFKIEAWHNDAQISDILDSVKKQYPEQFDRYMCHDWLSSTWSREPDC